MGGLLDSHTFLWLDEETEPSQLSDAAKNFIRDPHNNLYVSVASLWELQIKVMSGKLKLRLPIGQVADEQQRKNRLQILPIRVEHVTALGNLPLHHRDPFDKILAAQAMTEDLTLLSRDTAFAAYGVATLW